MALEAGGRADKAGNQYENHFLGKQLLLLAEGKLKTIEVEPLGEEGRGIEFISETNEGNRIYYQCKAGNGSSDRWTIAALAGHNVFKNAKQHILRSNSNEFHTVALQFILESQHPNKQADSICRQAVHCFEYDLHREISKQIIIHMVKNHSLDYYVLSPDFFKKNIVIERDRDFLLELIASNAKTRVLTSLLKYLSETEENIIDFAEVIHAVSKHLAELQEEGPVRLGIDEMIQCIVHLYDVGKDNPTVKSICLDAWDELFKNNLHDIKALATILDNFN